MTYKTILVHVGADEAVGVRLEAALSLARRFEATVLGVGALAWDPYIDPTMGFVDGATIQHLRQELDADLAGAEERFRKAAASHAHGVIWRSFIDYPGRVMSSLAHCADLIVASPVGERFDRRRVADLQDLVMESALPVLSLSAGPCLPRVVAVGWKNTRETRRAITDSLPLMKAAEKVVIIRVCEDRETGPAEAELEDVIGRLSRHGVAAEAELRPRVEVSVAQDLQAVARAHGADVLVLGAYGRSRLREWAFGGVTSSTIVGAGIPILFSR